MAAVSTDPFKYAKDLYAQDPSQTALQLGTAVKTQFPQLPQAEMVGLLGYVGYNTADAENAVAQLYGAATTFVVAATKHWQSTGVKIEPSQPTTINYVSGKWTANPATGMVDAAGNQRYVAKQDYTLPGAHEGALIGWVGEPGAKEGQVESSYPKFLVGKQANVPPGQAGILFLSINDDESGEYGAGFPDNQGEIVVNISEQAAIS